MLNSFKSLPRCLGALAVALCLMLGASVASAQKNENPPELSEKVSSGIAPLAALYEAKKWDEAIKAIDALLAKVEPVSFDRAFLCGYKAQLVFTKGDSVGAIEPLEIMLKVADELKLFRFTKVLPINEQDTLNTLAQLYMQEATTGKTPEAQRAALAKAHNYGKRMVSGLKPTADLQYMWARILYSEATFDSTKVDLTLMKQAAEEAEKALYLTVKPKEECYTLLLATLQQIGENARCAELLELLVKQFPNNKSFWPMLFQTYLALQGSGDKSADISAVITLERAQAAGQMVSNRDNYTLAGLYYNIQQYQFAADLLENGLHNGKIDAEQKNWELLALCYQQMGKEARAIDVYLEAIKLFPKAASLEQQVGQIYYNNDKHDEAYKHFLAAVGKGLERPAQTWLSIAYLALEAKKLDEAFSAAEKALAADPKSTEIRNFYKIVKDSVDEREKFKKQK